MEESKEEEKERGAKMEEETAAREEEKEERETYTNTNNLNYWYLDYLQSFYVFFDEVVRATLRCLGFDDETSCVTTSTDSGEGLETYWPQEPPPEQPAAGSCGGGGSGTEEAGSDSGGEDGGDSTLTPPDPSASEEGYRGRIRGRKPPKPGISTGKDPGIH